MSWQPIETANTDSIDGVLVWNGVNVTLAWFNDTAGEGWINMTDPQEFALDPQPTHWMPLPEPPAA